MNTVDRLCLEALELTPEMQAVLAAKLLVLATANNSQDILSVVMEAYLDDDATDAMKIMFGYPVVTV